MSNQTLSIINKATEKHVGTAARPYNIITFDTHERYQSQLAKTGHNFYSFRYDNCKEWVETYAPKPPNYYTLPKSALVNGIKYDFILSQSKFGQFQMAKEIAKLLRLPIVSLEHTLPIPSWPNMQLEQMRQMRGDINVFISDYSANEWAIRPSMVIKHSVDERFFCPLSGDETQMFGNHVLSVVNDFKNRDYCCNYAGWERITKGFNTKLVGDNPGVSKACSPEELRAEYRNARIFLNTSTISPVPTALLEAMACGCAVVSTATCMIPEIIQNGVNGFISNDEGELRDYIHYLLTDHSKRYELGIAARQTILDQFSEVEFVLNWNKVFAKAYGAKR